jgi:hypothetical protein
MSTEERISLEDFRRLHNGRRYLDRLKEHKGRLLVNLPIGVGKSTALDDIIEEATRSGPYNLVVILCPTRNIINERSWIKNPPDDISVVNIRPRPTELCGSKIDRQWEIFETSGLALLGKTQLCANCPKRTECFWPDQYSRGLKQADVVFAAQQHFERAPEFIKQIQQRTEATRTLILIDEINFVRAPFSRKISHSDIDKTLQILRQLSNQKNHQGLKELIFDLETLVQAEVSDLRRPEWILPALYPQIILEIQTIGWQTFGSDFTYIGSLLEQFGKSPIDSREKTRAGDILFATPPSFNQDLIVFSGTATPELIQHRIGLELADPFSNYQFQDQGTHYYNLANKMGMASYFPKNSPQIFDFFSDLLLSRIRDGKRVVLLSRKCFKTLCINEMQKRLDETDLSLKIINPDSHQLDNTSQVQIPIIHYGMIGENRFEDFDCIFALTGFYVNENAVSELIQEIRAEDFHLPIKIQTKGTPPRRTAEVEHLKDQIYDVHHLAQLALNDLEIGTVMQAAGRVRPFTKPREVFLFQCSELPQCNGLNEFLSLAEARRYFNILPKREKQKHLQTEQVQRCRARELTQKQTAEELDISLRTVKRHWKGGGHDAFKKIY